MGNLGPDPPIPGRTLQAGHYRAEGTPVPDSFARCWDLCWAWCQGNISNKVNKWS